jgi:hypothetical protein
MLARQLIAWIETGEVALIDRGFCGWGFIALLQRKDVDVVARLHASRSEKTGIVEWEKPQRLRHGWNKTLWDELPEKLTVRLIAGLDEGFVVVGWSVRRGDWCRCPQSRRPGGHGNRALGA